MTFNNLECNILGHKQAVLVLAYARKSSTVLVTVL